MGVTGFEWLAIFGIVLEMFGFIIMLYFWREPHTADVNTWKKLQRRGRNEDQYQERIRDDYPWFYDPVTNERFQNNWLVPEGFTDFWRRGKFMAFFSIIVGLGLQIAQMFD